MEQNKVNSFLLANKDNLPSDKIVYIKEKLNKADESSYDAVMAVKMKNPVVALILSILLGYIGIDRFYAGDILKGLLKNISIPVSLVILVANFAYYIFRLLNYLNVI